MHLTRYEMYRRIGAAVGHRIEGRILGISGIENFYPWIDRAKSKIVDVWYPQVDMQKLPFDAEEFDVVISDQVITNVENPFLAIAESFRVLKKGGLGIHTACSWSPILNYPKDRYRFTAEGLRTLCPPDVEIVHSGAWGNRWVLMLLLIRDPFFRYMKIPGRRGIRHWLATHNDERHPIHVWIVARKR